MMNGALAHQGKPACFPQSRLRRVCEGREGGSEENKLSLGIPISIYLYGANRLPEINFLCAKS